MPAEEEGNARRESVRLHVQYGYTRLCLRVQQALYVRLCLYPHVERGVSNAAWRACGWGPRLAPGHVSVCSAMDVQGYPTH